MMRWFTINQPVFNNAIRDDKQMGEREEVDLVNEQKFAKENREKLVARMPAQVSKREDQAFNRILNSKVSPAKKLESLYQMMEEMYRHVDGFTPCKKKCAACCHYGVTVSEVEIQHIERVAKKKRLKARRPGQSFHGQPCVFLKDDSCTIYAARPYVCRRHIALTKTAHWCDPNRSFDAGLPQMKFTGFEDAFAHIRRESGSFDNDDIRQVFGAAV